MLSSSWSTLCAQGSSSAFPHSNAAETYGGQTTIRRFLKDTTPSSLLPTFRSPLCGISVAMGGAGALVLLVGRALGEHGSGGLRAGVCELWNPLGVFKMLSSTVLRNDTFRDVN